MRTVGYSATGVNPHMSIYQFQNNGVGDFGTPKLWLEIMGCGPCLDAPMCIPAGACDKSGSMFVEPRR